MLMLFDLTALPQFLNDSPACLVSGFFTSSFLSPIVLLPSPKIPYRPSFHDVARLLLIPASLSRLWEGEGPVPSSACNLLDAMLELPWETPGRGREERTFTAAVAIGAKAPPLSRKHPPCLPPPPAPPFKKVQCRMSPLKTPN